MLHIEHKKYFIKNVEFFLPHKTGGLVNRSLEDVKVMARIDDYLK